MRHVLFLFTLLTLALPVQAYNPVLAEPIEAYSVIPVEGDPYIERTYLGDLEDAPDLYEFKTDAAISVRIQVKQRAGKDTVPFGLIMVRQNDADGGVEEVTRQSEPLESWGEESSHALGMTFLSAPTLQVDIKPGTYRIEVNTPDNKGTYALSIGEEAFWAGYTKSLWHVFKTQYHFGFTPLHALFSVYVYGTVAILSLGYGWYRFRTFRRENNDFTT